MHSLWFWKGWVKEYRALWYGTSVLLIFSFLFYWFYYFKGPDSTLQWEKFQSQKTVESVAHSFLVGNFEIAIPIESFYNFEYFNGASFQPNEFAAYAFLVVFVLAALMLLTVISTLSRFYYLVGMGLFILLLVSLRFNVLRIFGSTEQWFTIGVVAAYTLASFYYNVFNVNARLYQRFAVFTGITIIIAGLIAQFATVQYAFMHLWVTGYGGALILTVIFILSIGHEVIASFIYLVSQGTSTAKSLRHFLLISVVYIANLIITFMHEAKLLDWNFLYVNLYLLLAVSVVLVIWNYRKREPIYENIFEFAPVGALFIASMATIALITTGSLLGTANDPALKIIRDIILFSHLGIGFIFILYVISNFILMLAENMNVAKVLYRPNRMPYATFRIAGLIAVLGFVFYSDWKTYVYNGMSGFYNDLGDLYQMLDKQGLAQAYYEQGKSYGFMNHHSNYIVGDMEARRNNFNKAHEYYEYANYSRPTEYSLANEGNLYLMEGKYFTARTFLSNTLNRFPDSGPLMNNLGYAYLKINSVDSALLMLEKAREYKESKLTAETNFTALIAQESYPVKADSLVNLFEKTPALLGNALAIATTQQQPFEVEQDPLSYKELDLYSATHLNNYLVYNLKSLDSVSIRKAEQIADDSLNFDFREALKVTLAHGYYLQNNVGKALTIMGELAYLTQQRLGEYNYTMGLWALDQGSPALASSYFMFSDVADYKKAKLYNAIALAESHNVEALEAARAQQSSTDPLAYEIGSQLTFILTASANQLSNDLQRYQYARYRIRLRDSIQFQNLTRQFENPNYKAKAILEMAQRQHRAARTDVAISYMLNIDAESITDPGLQNEIQQFETLLLAYRGNLAALRSRMEGGMQFQKSDELKRLLYEALLGQETGDTVLVDRNFQILASHNVFFEEGVLGAAQYYRAKMPQSFTAYNIIADAVQVNPNSIRLQRAYAGEATRLGFDEYAQEALDKAEELLRQR